MSAGYRLLNDHFTNQIKTMEAFVLTTTINGRKNFVANQMSNRADNKKVINYTIDKNNAKDFGSEKAATLFIDKIFNPHERMFTAETIEVDEMQVQSYSHEVEEEIK
jgi:hypothetical protein